MSNKSDKKSAIKKKTSRKAPPKVTVVLGSGGVRGISQIGALEVLQEAGIPIDHVLGCSIGALIGSLYADTRDLQKVYEIALDVIPRGYCYRTFGVPSLRKGLRGKGFFKMKRLENILNKNLTAKTFEELKVPLSVVATNVGDGSLTRFSAGPLLAPLCASAAIPGFFQPIVIEDAHYVDGAVTTALPVRLAKDLRGDFIIAINVNGVTTPEATNTNNIIGRSYSIMRHATQKEEEDTADVVLNFDNEKVNFLFANKKTIRHFYEEGRRMTEKKVPKIQELLSMA